MTINPRWGPEHPQEGTLGTFGSYRGFEAEPSLARGRLHGAPGLGPRGATRPAAACGCVSRGRNSG